MARGFSTISAYDIDVAVVDAFNVNLRGVAKVHDLSRELPSTERPDVLIAGSPCQGFSTSGKRLVADPRNTLLFQAGRIAARLRPNVVVIENVPAAMSGDHSRHWQRVEGLLRWEGYNVRTLVVEGLSSGVPQIRKRLFLIAWLGSDCIRVDPDPIGPVPLDVSLAGLDGLGDHDPMPLAIGSREALIAARIPPGGKLSNVRAGPASVHTWTIPEVFGGVCDREVEVLRAVQLLRRRDRRRPTGDADPVSPRALEGHLQRDVAKELASLSTKNYLRSKQGLYDLAHTYNGKYRRLHWDRPSPTVDTHFGDPALFLHPEVDRGLTPREAARIQGFPDDFAFAGSRRRKFRMIGNAVPPPMAARLAAFVRAALL